MLVPRARGASHQLTGCLDQRKIVATVAVATTLFHPSVMDSCFHKNVENIRYIVSFL